MIADEKKHLTAHLAGYIAGKAGVKKFNIFHFSPRYSNRSNILFKEAQYAYEKNFVKQADGLENS